MGNWYAGRNAVKRAMTMESGLVRDDQVDRAIAAASNMIEQETRRRFYPYTETKLLRFPQRGPSSSVIVWLPTDLLSISALLSEAQNSSPTTIAAADYFLEPQQYGPPYNRIELDLSSTSAFQSGDTPQRSISVAGVWGYQQVTKAAGTVTSGLASSASATSMVVSNGALVDVGAQVLVESEQVQITEITSAAVASGALLDGALTADDSETSITVDASHGINAGEVVLVGSEKMLVEVAGATTLTVVRAYDGSVLAAHSNDDPISAFRACTITRAENGTTAATHANDTSLSRYVPPAGIEELAIAEAISIIQQEQSGWGRTVGALDAAREPSGHGITNLRKSVLGSYRRRNIGGAV